MNSPLISIIIPVYNKGKYIDRCLHSLLIQSFKDYELIVINDGSTDQSEQILLRYAHADDRIRYFAKKNGGVSSARNIGMELAQGEFIAFIDADDYVEEGYLEDIVKHVKRQDTDLYVWGVTKEFLDGNSQVCMPTMHGFYDRKRFLQAMIAEQYRDCPGICGFVSNKLLRRKLILDNHLHFDTQIKLNEDYDFFLSYYAFINTALVFNNVGYRYIQETENSSTLIKQVDYVSLIDIQQKCEQLIRDNKVLTVYNQRLIRDCINALALASLLELQPVLYSKVSQQMCMLNKRAVKIEDIVSLRPSLRYIVYNNLLLTIYLKIWQMYLAYRHKL